MEFNNKTELQLQEKIILLTEAIQLTSRKLFFLLALVLVAAVPLSYFSSYVFYSLLYSAPNYIIYQEPNPEQLKIVEKRVLVADAKSYFAFVRVNNPNSDLAVRELRYTIRLLAGNGEVVDTYQNRTYMLPNQDRILVLPAGQFNQTPVQVTIDFSEFHWSKVGPIPNLNFTFEGKQWATDTFNRFFVSAQFRNDNPYVISEAEIAAVLYNNKHEIVSVNSTVVNLLQPDEIRYIRLGWPYPVSEKIVDVDFKISVNQLQRNVLSTQPVSPDSFDPRNNP